MFLPLMQSHLSSFASAASTLGALAKGIIAYAEVLKWSPCFLLVVSQCWVILSWVLCMMWGRGLVSVLVHGLFKCDLLKRLSPMRCWSFFLGSRLYSPGRWVWLSDSATLCVDDSGVFWSQVMSCLQRCSFCSGQNCLFRVFYHSIWILGFFSVSVKNVTDILMRTAMNLCITLASMDIFTMLFHPIQEHGMSFQFFFFSVLFHLIYQCFVTFTI